MIKSARDQTQVLSTRASGCLLCLLERSRRESDLAYPIPGPITTLEEALDYESEN